MERCIGCLGILFGNRGRRNRFKYKVNYDGEVSREPGIEFKNLILEDVDQINYGTSCHFVSQQEKEMIAKKEYDKIIEEQKKIDEQIHRKTFEEEERLKIEEDRFREAQNAASRAISAAKKVQEFTKSHQGTSRNHPDHILYSIGDSDDSEDDFEAFLESVKVRSDAFRSNKTEFIDGIEALTQNNNKIVSAQPKSLAVTLEDLPHERDGIADGMSSDESFSYDQQNLEVANDNPELEWDKFVDGLEGDEVEIRNRTETEENVLKKTAREIENVT